jgi:hypothetical protein
LALFGSSQAGSTYGGRPLLTWAIRNKKAAPAVTIDRDGCAGFGSDAELRTALAERPEWPRRRQEDSTALVHTNRMAWSICGKRSPRSPREQPRAER